MAFVEVVDWEERGDEDDNDNCGGEQATSALESLESVELSVELSGVS